MKERNPQAWDEEQREVDRAVSDLKKKKTSADQMQAGHIIVEAMVEEVAEKIIATSQATSDAIRASNAAIVAFGDMLKGFDESAREGLQKARAFRMNLVGEIAGARAPLEDLRKFFLSDTHKEEIRRLNEFVDLCERLKALKDSGFLDTVADTMLRLASNDRKEG